MSCHRDRASKSNMDFTCYHICRVPVGGEQPKSSKTEKPKLADLGWVGGRVGSTRMCMQHCASVFVHIIHI